MTAGLALPRLAALIIAAVFLTAGLRGVGFGEHWDEQSLANRVKWSVVNGGTLLPGSYDWPSMAYWLALGSLVPDMTFPSPGDAKGVSELETALVARLDAPAYRMRLRRTFLIVTSLVLVWLYVAASAWHGSAWAGVGAAGLAAGSWQFGYHARWPAPDGLVVQFVALILLGAVLTRTRPASTLGPLIAAAASGLAIGSKYTAWPFALSWLLSDVAWRVSNAREWKATALRGVALIAAAFVLSTPGAVLQPLRFAASLAYLKAHYSSDATVLAPYLVGQGWSMLSASASYVLAALGSPWLPAALLISALALVGAVFIARRDATLLILVAGGPILLVSAMALQPVLLVRNLLPILAMLAFAAVAALAGLGARVPRWRPLLAGVVGVILSAHLAFLVHAARTIGASDVAVRSYAAEYAAETCASAAVADSMAAVAGVAPARICSDRPHALMPWEADMFPPPVVGRPRVLGPLDVDALYYPNWLGSQHIVIAR